MSDYFRPQQILILEAEVARTKAYLSRLGVPAGMVEGNTALLTEFVIAARRETTRRADISMIAAARFRHLMLGLAGPPDVAGEGPSDGARLDTPISCGKVAPHMVEATR